MTDPIFHAADYSDARRPTDAERRREAKDAAERDRLVRASLTRHGAWDCADKLGIDLRHSDADWAAMGQRDGAA